MPMKKRLGSLIALPSGIVLTINASSLSHAVGMNKYESQESFIESICNDGMEEQVVSEPVMVDIAQDTILKKGTVEANPQLIPAIVETVQTVEDVKEIVAHATPVQKRKIQEVIDISNVDESLSKDPSLIAKVAQVAIQTPEEAERCLSKAPEKVKRIKLDRKGAVDVLVNAPVKNISITKSDLAKGEISKTRGTRREGGNLSKFSESMGWSGKLKRPKFRKKIVATTMLEGDIPLEIKILGITDAIGEDGILIETKNRVRRLFSGIPLYERVQLHAYMELYNVGMIRHCQHYGGKFESKVIMKDPIFWSKILKKLLDVGQKIVERKSQMNSRVIKV